MGNFIEQLAGKWEVATGGVHIDEGGLDERVVGESEEDGLGMELASTR